mmetsp:Transcript_41608/g.104940  ORF Transcript_41608/g.104940 Transcript_41608/m.104940 type:complete len:111 (-) Transcript_41608:431-763(-)|eukprot:CAMPEP_0177652164 /NCGR_PEP_ID=MMETSP0447-20121125/12962_1 /TAXON_ID=0 /ORGANISM="Stygamoeba regulata, Strain BSH-02190019" /LENGTH=110 /DNA_ID=CAMNT_0019155347 /DNA_START=119 /DNA_END=451 /DNA_ORIENTATION=-
MSLPPQDMPPRGGFPPLDHRRRLPARGLSGALLLAVGLAASVYGVKISCIGRDKRHAWDAEEKRVRFFMVPLLQAEEDWEMINNATPMPQPVYRTREYESVVDIRKLKDQ